VEPRLPAPGDTVLGKYEIVRVLGRGGMGIVLEARQVERGQNVAIKFLLPEHATSREGMARFEREAGTVATLTTPHVTKIIDVDVDPATSLPFIVMELLVGHDLAEELRQRTTVPFPEAVDWILQACAALHEAHALGIVHRDIKPSNLFLTAGQRPVLKVMDFGISKLLGGDSSELTTSNQTIGTPAYMSPEQLLSVRSIDGRTDVWALGVVLYRALSGHLPFAADTPAALAVAIATKAPAPLSELALQLPAPLVATVMRTLERDVARRPEGVRELARLLQPFGTGRLAPRSAGEAAPTPARSTWWIPLAFVVPLGILATVAAIARAKHATAPNADARFPTTVESAPPLEPPPAPPPSPPAASAIEAPTAAATATESAGTMPHVAPSGTASRRGGAARTPKSHAVPAGQKGEPLHL
jgi:eukaryotic-like serine/threonine-protein kinase